MSTISFNIVDKVQSLPKKANSKNSSTKNITTKTKSKQKINKNKKDSKKDNKKINSPENFDDDENNETEDEDDDITDNDEDNDDEDETQPMSEAGRKEVITDVLDLLVKVITLSTEIYKESNGNIEEEEDENEEKDNDNDSNTSKSSDNIKTEELDFKSFNSRLHKRKLRNNEDTDNLKATKKSKIDFLLQPNTDKTNSKDKIDDEDIDSDTSITLEEIGKAIPINSKDKEHVYKKIDELVERNERILKRRSAKEKTAKNRK